MSTVLKHFRIPEEHIRFLESLPGTLTEHVRRAIDEYIQRLKNINVATSQSKKGDINNG